MRPTGWVLVVVLSGCGGPSAPADWRPMVDRWHYTDPLPPLPFIDQRGEAFTLDALADRWVLVGFIYTACPDAQACPMTTSRMRAVQDLWASEPREQRLHLLSFTLDPARDTPAALAAYAQVHGADPQVWTFATGDPALMTEGLPSLFNILTLPDGPGRIDHTVKLALLEPGLRVVGEYKDNAVTAEQIAAVIVDATP